MSGPNPVAAPVFDHAARLVIRRIWLRKGLAWMMRTLPYAAGALLVMVVLRVLGAAWCSAALAISLMILWMASCLIWGWLRRPKPYGALAFWDRRAARSDAFANAWWFEQQQSHGVGEQLHLRAQTTFLPAALPSLRKDIPLPDLRWLPIAPLLALALFFIHGGHGLALPDPALTSEGKKLAAEEGKRLSEKKLDVEKMKALTAEEKKEIEKLQQKVQDTARVLEHQETGTAREVLSELERRAHDAEQLAEKMGAGDAAWASEQMVAEMRKHADTAELGDAAANKSTTATSREAQKIADQLNDPQLTSETRDRFAETLQGVTKQAQPQDAQRTVGGRVLDAGKDLAQSLPKDAAKEFQALADQMNVLAQREKARDELEKLAQQLRDSGASIAGQGTQGMQQLAGNQGQSSGGAQQQQQMMAMPNAPQTQPFQMPGLSNAPQGQGQGQQGMAQNIPLLTPSPGDGKDGKSQALIPGKNPGSGKNDQPFLIAPIPGEPPPPGDQPMVAILSSGSSAGGLQAGNGTTDLGNKPTERIKPGQNAVVNAASNAEGESSVRAIEGGTHAESAERSSQAAALEAITQEENALDEAALPSARREQVRRYFMELRKRFEKQN